MPVPIVRTMDCTVYWARWGEKKEENGRKFFSACFGNTLVVDPPRNEVWPFAESSHIKCGGGVPPCHSPPAERWQRYWSVRGRDLHPFNHLEITTAWLNGGDNDSNSPPISPTSSASPGRKNGLYTCATFPRRQRTCFPSDRASMNLAPAEPPTAALPS